MERFENITTLIFDFGGVIMDLDKDKCVLNFKQLGLINIEHYLGSFVQSGIFLKLEKGELAPDGFRTEVKKMIPHTVTDRQIDEAWNSFLAGIPTKKLDMLLELKKRFRIFLLSNTNPIHKINVQDIFKRHKGLSMSDYFDKMYLSYEMGMVKPDPAIFHKLISDAEVSPNECLFLDDGPKNIEKGKNIGFQTYLVKENETLDFLLQAGTWK